MRLELDTWLMGIAALTAERSTCCRRHVGCVLVNSRNHVVATGYNGVAAGMPHCNHVSSSIGSFTGDELYEYPNACPGAKAPSGQNLDGCQAIHAEQNALLQCKDVYSIEKCYVTTSPCMTCVKLLLNTSCQEIYFVDKYVHHEAEKLWLDAGRRVWKQITDIGEHFRRYSK